MVSRLWSGNLISNIGSRRARNSSCKIIMFCFTLQLISWLLYEKALLTTENVKIFYLHRQSKGGKGRDPRETRHSELESPNGFRSYVMPFCVQVKKGII
jgi:hypothetical protein